MRREIKEFARRVYATIDPVNVFVYRLLQRDTPPIPPAINRMRVGSRSIGRFMEAGLNCYRPIRQAMQMYYTGQGTPRVLDFGCGVGRVLQYFCREPMELSACDVDASAIEFLGKSYPKVRSLVNGHDPPLPFEDGAFDVVYSVSVWTHLPPESQDPWLREMDRILRPRGLALLTTIGPYGYRRGTHLQAVTFSYDELMRSGFQYSEYDAATKERGAPGTGVAYGAAYHTPQFVREEWSRFFRVLDVQEGVIDNLNDLVVMEKRAPGG
jgi:SAM-dependent methyltransferase